MKTNRERDLETGVTTLRLTGELSLRTAPTVRLAIGKAATECPAAVLVDLSALTYTEPARLSVLATAAYQAQKQWGVPVVCCGASGQIRTDLGLFRTFVILYEDRRQAMTAVRTHTPRWIRRRLNPTPDSAATARAVLTEACLAWNLPGVRDVARLIANELAANAIVHAGTPFDLTTTYTGRYLRIAVQDGSTAVPRPAGSPPSTEAAGTPAGGYGLRMIDAASTHWGVTRIRGGKIVWTMIRAEPPAPAARSLLTTG